MPKKSTTNEEEEKKTSTNSLTTEKEEIENLNRMLAAVLSYLSDDEIEEIDIEYLLEHTEGLRHWWDQYREKNRQSIEEEIKQSLSGLSLEELEEIRQQIKNTSQ